ncbi:MAG: hypothetical protein ACXWL2_04580 [Candidatus Chromulinivorax sp.]
MKKKFQILTLIGYFTVAFMPVMYARSEQGALNHVDPYIDIRYQDAFNQAALYEKYYDLLNRLGCAENVFASNLDFDKKVNLLSVDDQVGMYKKPVTQAELEQFERECMSVLNKARTMALSEPLFDTVINVALMGISAAIITQLVSDSVASGFAGSNALYTTIFSTIGAIKYGKNFIWKPNNSLESLENHYAKNKFFIPKALWPKIEQGFIRARTSEFDRKNQMEFIDFALGFMTYKPKNFAHEEHRLSALEIKIELDRRIDKFFDDYTNTQDIEYIKINVAKFVDLLFDPSLKKSLVQAPRYIYLYGPGGIGKTHFVQQLSSWIDELLPQSVLFEDLVIYSADQLEGSFQTPGAFLKVLRNQLIQNKRGSVVMIDEATWLNSMISTAKRVFNGDQTKLETTYFGQTIDGTGIHLQMPPMLIFIASNEPIVDLALKSRFDVVNYPLPKETSLIDFAYQKAQTSHILAAKQCSVTQDVIRSWIQSLNSYDCNFRYVSGNVEAMILKSK